jgi:hypothetical protein
MSTSGESTAQEANSRPKLAQCEWDFSNIPDAQLDVCFAWEYAREWDTLRHGFKSEVVPRETITVNWGNHDEFEPEDKANPDYEEYERDPDSWVGCIKAGLLTNYMSSLYVPWQDLPKHLRARMFQYGTPEAVGLLEIAPRTYEFNTAFMLGGKLGNPAFSGAAFRINWDQSDTRLLADFASWLKDKRQKPAKEQRGRERRGDLNMLGAMRLLHHMPLEEAIIETTRALGEPLYGKRPSWERARKSALRVFQEDFLVDTSRWGEEQIPLSYPKFAPDLLGE